MGSIGTLTLPLTPSPYFLVMLLEEGLLNRDESQHMVAYRLREANPHQNLEPTVQCQELT